MRITQYPRAYREALAYWCALRNLGFSADQIFLGFGPVDLLSDCLFLQLQAQGQEFTVTVERIPGARQEEVHATWTQMAESLQQSNEEERQTIFAQHPLGQDLNYYAAFVLAIQRKGIAIPLNRD